MEEFESKYKAALEYMRRIYPTLKGADKEDAEHYFPELVDSRDETIRKAIIGKVRALKSSNFKYFYDDVICDEVLDWLNKQRPEEWSEEDNVRYNSCLKRLQADSLLLPEETVNSLWFKKHCYKKPKWKPSEGQLKALKTVANAVYMEDLNSLFEDLLTL